MKIFSLDFKIVDPSEAVVPVMDRGFLYGDSVYEAVRTYRGTIPFLLDRHFTRLLRSAERIELSIPFGVDQLFSHVVECVRAAKNPDSYIRIVVSRGTDNRFSLIPQPSLRPRTIILVDHIHTYPSSYYEVGIRAALVSVRRNLKTALDPNIKSGNYLNNMLALVEAQRRNATEAIMLNHEDYVTEATTSNVFMVKNGVLITPAVESGLLEGISRALLKEIIQKEGIRFEERAIPRAEFVSAEEAFITGTTKEIMPIAELDGKPIGKGVPGEVTRRLMKLFSKEVDVILAAMA